MKHLPRILIFLLIITSVLAMILSFSGCRQRREHAGIVASVNGEPVYMHSLQASVDGIYGNLIIGWEDSVDEFKAIYGRALESLIVHALVRQELHKKGIPIDNADIESFTKNVSGEFGQSGYQDFIAEGLISENDWKYMLRDHLALRLFEEKILIPQIRLDAAEIAEYYKAHQSDFILPELFCLCLAYSASKDALQEWKKTFPDDKSVEAGDVSVQNVKVSHEEISKGLFKDAGGIKAGQCAPIRQAGSGWTLVCLREKIGGSRLGMAEAYALIDSILRAEKGRQAFDRWLAESILKSDIKVTPELNKVIGFGADAESKQIAGGAAKE